MWKYSHFKIRKLLKIEQKKFKILKFINSEKTTKICQNLPIDSNFAQWLASQLGHFVIFLWLYQNIWTLSEMRGQFEKCKILRCNPTRNLLLLVIFYQHWWSPIFILVIVPCYKLWTKNDKNVTKLLVILLNQISASCDMSRLVVFHRELCQPDVISARWYFIRIEIIVK